MPKPVPNLPSPKRRQTVDDRLRGAGYKIDRRPEVGEPLWRYRHGQRDFTRAQSVALARLEQGLPP